MHSGNGNSGYVSREELQQLFLPKILETYAGRGYRVLEVVGSRTEDVLERGVTGILTDKLTPVTLEHIVTRPETVTAIYPGKAYVASSNGRQNNPELTLNDPVFAAQYRGIEFNALLFFVTQTGVIVRRDNPQKPVQLSFYEFLEALEKWLPKAATVMAGEKKWF